MTVYIDLATEICLLYFAVMGMCNNRAPDKSKVQVCENNLVRRIVGTKRGDKRRVDDMRLEVEVKEYF